MDWQKTAENMKKRGFTVRRYATGAEAAEALCEELKGQEIGMGGSVTAAQLGLPEKLEAAGCTVYARGRSWDRKDTDKGVTAPVYIRLVHSLRQRHNPHRQNSEHRRHRQPGGGNAVWTREGVLYRGAE